MSTVAEWQSANISCRSDNGRALIRSWMDEAGGDVAQGQEPLTATVLRAAQRSDVPMLVAGKDEDVLGEASTGDRGIVVTGLPLPAGLSATVQDIRSGRPRY